MGILDPNLIPPDTVELEEFLKRYLKGQQQAIKTVSKSYTYFKSGMKEFNDRDKKRPIGVFLFLGASGVGKTKLPRVLAQKFYGTQKAVTLIDCGSYQERHEVAKLIGSPPGYLGHDEPPRLSKSKLYSVIPGYQIQPDPQQTKGDKQEQKKKEDEEEDIGKVTVDDMLVFWINQLTLIDEGLRNIDRKFAQLRRAPLSKEELEERKDDLRTHRKILNMQRDQVLTGFTELVLHFLEDATGSPDSSPPVNKSSKGKKVIPIAKEQKTPTQAALKITTKKEDPILIIIFDEIEKAHLTLHQFLLHLMEEGQAVLGNHEEVDLSRAFIVLTSNIASKLISKATKGITGIGFSPKNQKGDLEKMVRVELKKIFSQEFLNRLDATVIFNILSLQDFKEILELLIENLTLLLSKTNLELMIDQPVKDFILQETVKNPEGQARTLEDCFKKHLTNPIGNLLATKQLAGKKKLTISLDAKNKIIFTN